MFSQFIHFNNNTSCLKVCCNNRDWKITYRPLVLTNKKFYTTIDGKVISAGELFVKTKYIYSMQENTNWYWKQQPLQQTIIFPTRTILNPRLDIITIRYVQDTPKNIFNRIQAKKSTQRHPIIMTDAKYDYILDEIEHSEKLSLKGMWVEIVTRNSTDDKNHNVILYVVFHHIIIKY